MTRTSNFRLPVWLPNMVTIMRIVAGVSLFIAIFYDRQITGIRMGFFMMIVLTDWVDGWLARKFNARTSWGQLLDPIADKVVLLGAFAYFFLSGDISGWFTILYFAREILQTIIRISSFANSKNSQTPTLFISKLKTALSYCYGLLLFAEQLYHILPSTTIILLVHTVLEVFIILLSYTGLIKPFIRKWN
ncbi:CDP-alcohol phosphatidyltransferase family protein [Niastella caeni]|uniref:CDP-diacylglycerol--glycerol-3-phosphate 3-phosphatidyltransferase n=1 Tax=Niastella caeni TaxID=2569763 RepID=A0A4S8HVY9_9BACT|nr:CDP-alcohol phosphatidyltransferase family protein [Niastella caeni]THU39807.1 CDP-alcohol phosphatidyltransferase family protein [Niastella caeni]